MPEQVYALLMSGAATLHMVAERKAFLVLQRLPDPDGATLFVFAIWGEPNTLEPVKDALYAALEDLARTHKCRRIRMQGRKGWNSEPFWKATATLYEHEVTT